MTGFEEVQLLGCVYELLEYLKNPDIRVIYDKYALSCHGNISVSMLEFLKYKGLA